MSITAIYKAMADETRLRILHALSLSSLNVQELQKIVGAPQSNVSHHLKTLERAGLVDSKSQGTWRFYSLSRGDNVPAKLGANFVEIARTDLNGLKSTIDQDTSMVNELIENRQAESRAYFDKVAGDWRQIRESIADSKEYLAEIKKSIPQEAALLELGCGSGIMISQLMPRSGETIGVDYSPAMLSEARENLSKYKVDLRLGYLEHLPLADGSVDIALCHMVLHHLQDPSKALSEAARVLKKSGKMIIIDLEQHSDERLREVFAHRWLGFDTKELSRTAKQAGFAECKATLLGEKKNVFMLIANK
jgi:ArsR family transcriptional regulator